MSGRSRSKSETPSSSEQLKRGERSLDDAVIDAIIERFNALPVPDDRTDDELLDDDKHGLPS